MVTDPIPRPAYEALWWRLAGFYSAIGAAIFLAIMWLTTWSLYDTFLLDGLAIAVVCVATLFVLVHADMRSETRAELEALSRMHERRVA
jgi:hypothetical protein